MPKPAPKMETKIKTCHNCEKYKINLQKNTSIPLGQAHNLPTGTPTSTPRYKAGFPHPAFLSDNTTTTRGVGVQRRTKKVPLKSPLGQHSPQPNPLFISPHPHPRRTRPPFFPGTAGAPGLSLAQCWAMPSPPYCRGPGFPPRSSAAVSRRHWGFARPLWEQELTLRAPMNPSSSPSPRPPSSPPRLPPFLLSVGIS